MNCMFVDIPKLNLGYIFFFGAHFTDKKNCQLHCKEQRDK